MIWSKKVDHLKKYMKTILLVLMMINRSGWWSDMEDHKLQMKYARGLKNLCQHLGVLPRFKIMLRWKMR
ncbi:hypothetical protein Gogos_010396 [Gossypium gossypioides]|uniref:Uncharacterized protein n=1 Tax=Gossypium gossypioides TaxID=34282 RepID=A0A7J9BL38_GOSGO|nr:hypothetical protein [Gossypium gossypioides]